MESKRARIFLRQRCTAEQPLGRWVVRAEVLREVRGSNQKGPEAMLGSETARGPDEDGTVDVNKWVMEVS